MKRVGMAVALASLVVALTPWAASGDWNPEQTPAEQEIWRIDGPSACPEVFFIGLRGSGQNDSMAGPIEFGDQIERLYRSYAAVVHGSSVPGSIDGARVAPVPPPGYRAVAAVNWVDLTDPFGAYWESVDEGAAATARTVRAAAQRCGDGTKFVLAGFSQGAQAVTEALPKIPKEIRPRIAAVLLVASPTWRADQPITYFGHDPDWVGSLAGSCTGACGGAIKSWARSRTAALCHEGDAVCTGVGFGPIHADYTDQHMDELAAWAAARTVIADPVPTCDEVRATHVGTEAADVIKGTRYADVVVALRGRDTVTTRGGDDRVCAGGGNDTISTGSGNDRVWAGSGSDSVSAGPGHDRIWGEAGSDVELDGGGGDDVIRGGGADDRLVGGKGSDRLFGGSGDDVCDGGAGSDEFDGCETSVP
ncbi:MAG: cutinase family protein [Acidimicrobiia bacterium]|nr:cutinase family protein [Acidimicrobiia bacterium]